MANNEISGPVVSTFVAKYFQRLKNRYSIRFVFIPETIGAIAYISINYINLSQRVSHLSL